MKYILILALFPTIMLAQTNKMSVGIEAGVNLTFERGRQLSIVKIEKDPWVGFSGGFTFQYNYAKRLSIRTNVYVERKSTAFSFLAINERLEPIGEVNAYMNYNYLTVPLLTQLTLGNKTKFYLNAGPYMGYLMKQTLVYAPFLETPAITTDNTDSYNKLDLGLSTGVGIGFPVKEKWLFTIEARNNRGLYVISKSTTISYEEPNKLNSTSLMLGIHYLIGVKKEE